MYVIPKYNQIDNQESCIIITSKLHGNIVKISDKNLLNEFREIYVNGCTKINSELKKFLYKEKILILKENFNENLEKIYNYMNSILQITILPTEACNFRCEYCYEDHHGSIMNFHIIEHIKTFIESQIEKYHFSNIYLYWFGGEPTLCTKAIFEINNFIIDLQKKYTFKFHSSITTNGYLLNKDLFEKLYSVGIRNYQITLDGWNHDKKRPYIDGTETLDIILNNLKSIAQLPSKLEYTILLRHNVLANDNDLSWYDYLYKYFGNDHRFVIFIKPVSNYGNNNENKLMILSKGEQKKVLVEHINYAKNLGFKVYNKDSMSPLRQVCYAAYKHSYVFRESGDIVKCTIDLDNPINKIGFIDINNGVHIFENKNIQWSSPAKLESECYQCSHVLSCLNSRCPRGSILGERNCSNKDGVFV